MCAGPNNSCTTNGWRMYLVCVYHDWTPRIKDDTRSWNLAVNTTQTPCYTYNKSHVFNVFDQLSLVAGVKEEKNHVIKYITIIHGFRGLSGRKGRVCACNVRERESFESHAPPRIFGSSERSHSRRPGGNSIKHKIICVPQFILMRSYIRNVIICLVANSHENEFVLRTGFRDVAERILSWFWTVVGPKNGIHQNSRTKIPMAKD